VVSDSDFLVRATWEAWHRPRLRKETAALVQAWQQRIERNPEEAFAELAELASFYYRPAHQIEYNPVLVPTVSILLRRLTFGGVIRLNAKGVLNVGLSQDKLQSFLNGWEFTWPAPPKSLKVFGDWSGVTDWIDGVDGVEAIAIVDPPYCAGTTDAYANAGGDAAMALDCIEALLASGNVTRIVAFNYWGEMADDADTPTEYPICDAMQMLAHRHGVEAHLSHLGTLATMNKGAGKTAVHRFEGVWEIGGKRMYGSRPIVKPDATQYEQMAFA